MDNQKLLYSIEQLDNLFCGNKCLIYGAGRVAKAIMKFASGRKYKIDGILVSNRQENSFEIMGVPVCSIEDYSENLKGKSLIIATMENMHCEIEAKITEYNCENYFFISNELFKRILYNIGDFETDNSRKLEKIEKLLRFVPRPCLEYIVLNILDHCNLKCKGCDHFACVADPYFVAYETIHQDLDRLAEIFHGDYITKIAVMGGEPLLHPDLLKILKDVREHFPYAIIRLTTNGLLLLKQEDAFWHVCKEQNITIVNTKYPINLNFNMMKERSKQEGVRFEYFEGTGEHDVKTSFKKIINLKGDSDPVESFADCHISNYGNFLMEGKLYGCPFSCQSYRIFNKKFNQNLRMTEKDFLDIYKVRDMQEILDFAARPKYYCRYCRGLTPPFEWSRSKKEIGEWVNEEELSC